MAQIVVPIKQVPDMERVRFDQEKGTVDRSSAPGEINPFDLNAIEAAVQIKEKIGGSITAVSMGPPQAESSLRDALSRGVDRAVLLVDRAFAGADTWATSYTLAVAIKRLGQYDLIICGEKTVDGDTGQVGPSIAEWLGIPHVAYVSQIREVRDKLKVLSDMERERYVMELGFPVLITVTKDLNVPRLASFSDKMKARKAQIEQWGADELSADADPTKFGLKGSPTRLNRVIVPSEEGRKGEIFRGAPQETVGDLVDVLSQNGLLEGVR
ncbi:MAG: electron transfer flavoprotein subunit beta/FixA family protein [Chloroflexota bacterium]